MNFSNVFFFFFWKNKVKNYSIRELVNQTVTFQSRRKRRRRKRRSRRGEKIRHLKLIYLLYTIRKKITNAISGSRRTWPGRNSRQGFRQRPFSFFGNNNNNRHQVTRSLEDARFIQINFRLIAEIYSFELVSFSFFFFLYGGVGFFAM